MAVSAEDRLAAIARLDAELAAAAAPPSVPPLMIKRVGYFGGGLLGGWLFGGAVSGPVGIPFCTALGAIAGGFRALTGRPLLEYLSETALLPMPGSKTTFTGLGTPGAAMPKAAPADCGNKGTKKCAG